MNLGFPEMIFLFFLALIIFGPKKLPEIGRQIGKALNEFKRASNEFKAQIESEISKLDVEVSRPEVLPPSRPPQYVVSNDPAPPASETKEQTPVPPSDSNLSAEQPTAVATPPLPAEALAGLPTPSPEPEPSKASNG